MKTIVMPVIIFLFINQLVSGAILLVPDKYPTIGEAVNACANGDEVVVADGIYTGSGNRDIVINKKIIIRSKNGPERCIIDCNSIGKFRYRAFVVRSDVRIAGFTIINGYTTEGGAILFEMYNSEIINCIFSNNFAERRGGAIFCRSGNLTVINSSFFDNSSLNGGAIYCEMTNFLMSQCTVSRNTAIGNNQEADGGGIACSMRNNINIQNCIISDNTAESNLRSCGGGIWCTENSNLAISNSKIKNNTVRGGYNTIGGGILCYRESSLILNDSIITGNICEGNNSAGCGIYFEQYASYNVKCTITGCTIEGNIAKNREQGNKSYGGGVFIRNARPIISKCIIRNNAANAGAGIRLESANSLIGGCIVSGNFTLNRNQENSGISYLSSNTYIGNCTIVGNTSYGLHCQGGTANVENSILYYNGHDYQEEMAGSGYINIVYSNVQRPKPGYFPWPGEENIYSDPCFIKSGYWDANGTPKQWEDDFWVEGDYQLLSISPCINTGCFTSYLLDSTDLDGNPRVIGKTDMGAYEFKNTVPISNAGSDQTVYSYIDGIVEVELDGSDSNDSDGDELSYKWTWSIDGNTYEVNSINPTIELPVGLHTIELVVNDGTGDSKPDYVDVNVVEAVEGELKVTPQAISLASKGNWIKACIVLPEGFGTDDVNLDVPLVCEPVGIQAESMDIRVSSGVVCMPALFDRQELCAGLSNGEQELSVVGQFKSGQYFYGKDIIRMIGKKK